MAEQEAEEQEEEDEAENEDEELEISKVQIRSSNRQRKRWTREITKDIATKMEKKKIAIYGFQETAIYAEDEKFFADSRCHCFFVSFLKKELQKTARTKQLAKIDKKLKNLEETKPPDWESAHHELTATRAHIMKSPGSNHVAKQGIALFVLKSL